MTHGKCVCHGPNGTYNLQPLQRTDNKPRFQTTGRWHYEYFYNPCTSFLKTDEGEDAGCTFDVAVCYGGQGGGPYVKIGDQSSAECKTDAETGRPELVYKTAEYPGEEHAVRILLICDWERKIPKFQETKVKGYSWVLSLTHRCACANGCPEDPSTTRRTTVATTRTTTPTTTGLRTITGTTNRTTAVFPFTQEPFWTPLVISCVVIGGLIVFIAVIQLIRIAVRRCNHDPNNHPNNDLNNERNNDPNNDPNNDWNNERDDDQDNDRDNDPRQKLLSNGSDDVRGFKNVLPRNPCCNITVSKKDDFNSGKFVTGPI